MPLRVLLVTVKFVKLLWMPPPKEPAELSLTVLLLIVTVALTPTSPTV